MTPRIKNPKEKTKKLLNELEGYMRLLKAENQKLYHMIEKNPADRDDLDKRMKKLIRHMWEVSLYIDGLKGLIYDIEEDMEDANI